MRDLVRIRFRFVVLLVLVLLVPVSGRASVQGLPNFAGLVKQVSPAVVNISTTQKVAIDTDRLPPFLDLPELPPDHPLRDFLKRFRNPNPNGEGAVPDEGFNVQSLGSGFVISPDGYVLTNYHVVRGAEEIVVRLSDRREFIAKVVGSDERSDLALLKIDAKDLPVVRMGKSNELEVGEWVLAIGSPFGFEHSATAGIVSAKGRSLPQENYVPFIQTDVAINPGNSGGPLFNMDGEVVGINSQIYSRTGGFMGLSFAIPIELAIDVSQQLKMTGHVSRGWLGVRIQDITRDLAESFGMPRPSGALVAEVMANGPADRAGIKVGDVIVEYDGQEVATSAALPPMVGRTAAGDTRSIKVIRDGKPRVLKVKIAELPDEVAQDGSANRQPGTPAQTGVRNDLMGIQVDALTKEQQETLGAEQGGVLVLEVMDGPAREAGIQPGDVITMINQRKVKTLEDFRKAAEALQRGKSVPVLVYRGDSPRFIALKVPENPTPNK